MHPTPSLYCDFTKNPQPIQAGISIAYSGGTGGSRFNQFGFIETGIGSPRTDYDPASTITNLCPRSGEFDAAVWAPSNVVATFVPGIVAPREADERAYKLIPTAVNAAHLIDSPTIVSQGGVYTISLYAKAAEEDNVVFAHNGTGTTQFNLTTGAITNISLASAFGMIRLADGWFRLWVVTVPLVTSTNRFDFYMRVGAAYNADGVSGLYVAAAMFEPGAKTLPSVYLPAYATAPRVSAPTCLGLLIEEARTNICLQSEDFSTTWTASNFTVTTNIAQAPSGANNADKIVETAVTAAHQMLQSIVKAASSITYTYSVFLKAAERNFVGIWLDDAAGNGAYCVANLATGALSQAATLLGAGWTAQSAAIQAYPNGWYRVQITATSNTAVSVEGRLVGNLDGTSSAQSYLGVAGSGFYVWGAQMEVGPGPSSYIPTTVASATRLGETQNIVAGQIGAWFNQNEGTWIARFVRRWVNSQNGRLVGYNNGTTTPLSFSGGIESYDGTSPTDTINQVTDGKLSMGAGAYRKTTDISVCLDGGGVVNSVNANFPTVTQIDIGGRVTEAMQGHLQTLAYYPRRLSDQTIKTLTTPTQ